MFYLFGKNSIVMTKLLTWDFANLSYTFLFHFYALFIWQENIRSITFEKVIENKLF